MAGVAQGPDRIVAARAFGRTMANLGIAVGAAVGAVALQFDDPFVYKEFLAIDALTYLSAAADGPRCRSSWPVSCCR